MSSGGDEGERIEFDYAWGWFQYHASQRLTAFNFFLVIVGLILVAYAQAIDRHWVVFGIGLGMLGAIVAAGFLALDVRNLELVMRGKAALKTLELERAMRVSLIDRNGDRAELGKALLTDGIGDGVSRCIGRWFGWFFQHRLWLRGVIFVVGVGFVAGAAWAGFGYPGTGSPDLLSCRDSTVLVLHRPGFDLNLVKRSEREGEQRGANDDRGRPNHGLSGDLHVQSVGMGDYKRVQTGRHCGKEPVGGG
jgi:hypothetical protein